MRMQINGTGDATMALKIMCKMYCFFIEHFEPERSLHLSAKVKVIDINECTSLKSGCKVL